MKLIFCPHCHDIVRLTNSRKSCECGRSYGKYEPDGLNATINDVAIPLGFANDSFVEALRTRPKNGWGVRFEAFVIPEQCDSVEVQKTKREKE